MKKFLVIAGLTAPLLLAAPAQAGHESARGLSFEDVLRQLVITHTDVSYRSGARHHRQDNGWQNERRVIPIARLVRQIQRDTGGRVTSVRLKRNGRVYAIEGVGRGGRYVTAKANARTGEVFDVQRLRGGGHVATNGKPIPRLLKGLRDRGFHAFDRVIRDGRTYIVRGLNRRGNPVRIVANARNGRVLSVNQARNYNGPNHLRHQVRGFDHWRSGLQQQRYSHFGNATRHDDYYQVGARDRRGRDVTLNVCARTGRVLHTAYR
ncbi:peptidase propeptide and YPEB domain protein [Rhodobiaceae bacterium]|nr:peptidase propeptide and YPEB domain protein [Rhodobiaceae bacterium]